MELNVDIIQQNIQVVEIEKTSQEVVIQSSKEVVELTPTYLRIQDINITKSWFTLNIDRDDMIYYYIQFKLDVELQYKIQRIHKTTYEIKYHTSNTDEWINRNTLIYE